MNDSHPPWTNRWGSTTRDACSFPNPVSHRDVLTCDDASCLTSCHRAICLKLVSLLQNVGIHPLGDTAGWVGLPLMGLQRVCPQIRTALEDHRVDGLVLGLDPVPESPLAELSSQLIFSPEPLLSTSDPVGVDFVEQV